MLKNKKLGCLSLLLFTPVAMAMQPLDDQSLSAMTGQDGLTVSVNISKIDFTIPDNLYNKELVDELFVFNNSSEEEYKESMKVFMDELDA